MKLTIEPTSMFVDMTPKDGKRVLCRAWKGVTDKGVDCWVFTRELGVRADKDHEQFDLELTALPPGRVVPYSEIL